MKQKDFKQFEKAYAQVKRENRAERQGAVGTLTPQLLQRHLKSGQDLVLDYGRDGKVVKLTPLELKSFANQIKRAQGKSKPELPGVPLLHLIRASAQKDKVRMNQQIRNATLYKFNKNILSFRVSASPGSDRTHHQVKVRLEEWFEHLTGETAWPTVTQRVCDGRVSFDCSCGRHQFWYRYLATIGGFALSPKEKDFPKIRNPRLRGCCCKHMLKVIQQLKSPSVRMLISKELERQSGSSGYMDKKSQSRLLSPSDLQKANRARGSDKESEGAKAAYKEFKEAGKAFKEKLKKEKTGLEKELKVREAIHKKALKTAAQQAEKATQQVKRDILASSFSVAIDMAETMGMAREDAIKMFVDKQGIAAREAESIIKEYNI